MKNARQLPPRFLDQVTARIHNVLGDNLVAVVLFGSYAKGTARMASDLDLLVVARSFPHDGKRDELLLDAFDDLVMETGIQVMPIFMTPEELRMDMEVRGPLMFGLVAGYRIAWGKLPLLLKWERFVRKQYRLSRKYDAWIIKDRSNLRQKPNLK